MEKENVIDAIEFAIGMYDREFFVITINKIRFKAYGYKINDDGILEHLNLLGKDGKPFMSVLLEDIREICF